MSRNIQNVPPDRILDALGQAVIATDAAGRVTHWNRAAETLYGWTRAEALGQPILELTPTEMSREEADRIMAALTAGESFRGEFMVRDRSGRAFPAMVSDVPLFDDAGDFAGVVGVSWDLTETKRLEARSHETRHLDALGRLAGAIAHDFNNLLTVIRSSAELAEEELGETNPVQGDLRSILDASDRAADLTHRLLALGGRQTHQVDALILDDLVRRMRPALRKLAGKAVTLRTSCRSGGRAVIADPEQLERALLHLAGNAIEAVGPGGRVTVRTRSQRLDPAQARAWRLAPGPYLALEVCDDGPGVDPKVADRLFEPFTSTKEKAFGLGLPFVRATVTPLGGGVEVRSGERGGTRALVLLPEADPGGAAVPLSESRSAKSPAATVLVVDDQAAVRALMVRLLERDGHRVMAAATGTEALGKLDEDVDLVVTDVIMPGLTGPELVERIRERRPDLPALLVSGHTGDALRGQIASAKRTRLLHKPFSHAAFREAVQTLLVQPSKR